jgi:hypothetical protein
VGSGCGPNNGGVIYIGQIPRNVACMALIMI